MMVLLLAAHAQDAKPDWRVAYDFDGDGVDDVITDEFSGGAHCCYRIGVALSSTGTTVMLPFEIDGGYVLGLDLSQPGQFDIRTPVGGLPELVVELYDPASKPRKRRVACFPGGELRVRRDRTDGVPCGEKAR